MGGPIPPLRQGMSGASWPRPRWQVCYPELRVPRGGTSRKEQLGQASRVATWPALSPSLPSPRSMLPCAWEAHVSGGLGVGCTTWAHGGRLLMLSAQHTSLGARRPWFQTQLCQFPAAGCVRVSCASVFSSLKWDSYS